MRISVRLPRAAWLPVSALAVATLVATATPVAADDVGVQVVQEVNDLATGPTSVPYNTSGTLLLDHFFSGTSTTTSTCASLRRGREGCRGSCRTELTDKPAGDYVLVLTGFRFKFLGDDHHIEEIGILEDDQLLTHYFNDNNDDDEYNATVEYAWVPRALLSNISSVAGRGSSSVRRTIPAGNKVIRGFHVDYLDGADNHIKRFGFLTNSTTVDIYFEDKDPLFSYWFYELRYATLN